MTDCEHTFEIASSAASAWKALEEVSIGRADTGATPREWWIPGFESKAVEVDRDPHSRLTVRKAEQPCEGTLIAIAFEHIDTGTRVRVVQSGFDEAWVRGAGESFWTHARHIFADLELFMQTGVIGKRAWRSLVWLGIDAITTSYGVQVATVNAGTWAERVGLQPNDIVLTIAGAPIFSSSDIGTVQRVIATGTEVGATWVRGGEYCEASAPV